MFHTVPITFKMVIMFLTRVWNIFFRVEDSGNYCCRLHNSPDRNEVKFTRPTVVNVRPSPGNFIEMFNTSHHFICYNRKLLILFDKFLYCCYFCDISLLE